MAFLKNMFPYSFQARSLSQLLVTVLLYIIAGTICGMVIRFLGSMPLMGVLFSLVGGALWLYFFFGIIVAILCFLNVLK